MPLDVPAQASSRAFARRTSSSTCWRTLAADELRRRRRCDDDARLAAAAASRDRGARPPGCGRRTRHVDRRRRGRDPQLATAPCSRWSARATTSTRAHAGAVNVTTIRAPSRLDAEAVRLRPGARGGRHAGHARVRRRPAGRRRARPTRPRSSSTALARYRESLAGSYNLAAVHTLATGRRAGAAQAPAPRRPDDADASPRTAYPTVARDRRRRVPHHRIHGRVRRVRHGRPRGRAARDHARARPRRTTDASPRVAEPTRGVLGREIAYLIFDILARSRCAHSRCSASSAPLDLDVPGRARRPARRARTRTISAFGTTAEYTVGAWGGNFDGTPTAGVMAMQGAAPLVRAAFVALAARFGAPTAPDAARHARAR